VQKNTNVTATIVVIAIIATTDPVKKDPEVPGETIESEAVGATVVAGLDAKGVEL